MRIHDWPIEERPREKLLAKGAKHLSNAELLAIILRIGIRGKTALDLARELLSEFGSLKNLFAADPGLIFNKPGLGKAKYAMLHSAIELGRRYLEEEFPCGEIISESWQAQRFLINRMQDYPHEVFACLFLDAQNRLICYEELFTGTVNEASVYPREVVKRALRHNAVKIIFAHNHPSGNPTPSDADIYITQHLKRALALIQVQVIDHIIIAKQKSRSFM